MGSNPGVTWLRSSCGCVGSGTKSSGHLLLGAQDAQHRVGPIPTVRVAIPAPREEQLRLCSVEEDDKGAPTLQASQDVVDATALVSGSFQLALVLAWCKTLKLPKRQALAKISCRAAWEGRDNGGLFCDRRRTSCMQLRLRALSFHLQFL